MPVTGFASPQILKIKVEKGKLENLLKKFAQWKESYGQLLQQYDLKVQHSRDKQAMLNSEQVSESCLLFRNLSHVNEHFQSIDFISGEKNLNIFIEKSFTGYFSILSSPYP